MRKQWVVGAAAVAAGCLLTAIAPTPGMAAGFPRSRSYTYVATDFYVAGPELAAKIVSDKTGVNTAPLGHVTSEADGNRFAFRVTDRNPLADAAVTLLSEHGWRRDICAPRGRTVVVEGVPADALVSLWIWDAASQHTWCPSNRATTGTLTLNP